MAETAKHTPGNWTTTRNTMTGAVFAGDEFIASVYPNAPEGWDGRSEYDRIDEMRANARLISAAPDLLEALYAADLLLQDHKMSLPQVKAAIAKAEGRL